jgi:ankyrin repeat protein
VSILDALYLAGADLSLFTSPSSSAPYERTPLHVLALCAPPAPLGSAEDAPHAFSVLYSLAIHLVRDLRAPLDARDRDGETPIHIAAERGRSIDVLLAFLDCDVDKRVSGLRNSRG